MMTRRLCLDTNYLVSLFDDTDLFAVLARRSRQTGTAEAFPALTDRALQAIQETTVTWLYPYLPLWYSRCLGIMRETQGHLSFHDALIVVAMQELGFSALLSFDAGFDEVVSINRLGSTNEVALWLKERHP